MIETAYAMGQSGAGTSGASGGFASFIPLILMFVIFYFLLIRPQQKKNKEHRQMISDLKIGNKILTTSGIYARIINLSDDIITVEIADKVRIKIDRNSVSTIIKNNSNSSNDKS